MKQVKVRYKHTEPMIVLVGPMGAGKSTIGRALARKMKLSFVDIDTEIEKETGLSISEIFESAGELSFRNLESKTLAKFCCSDGTIIATGGGAILADQNRVMIRHGLVVYLHASPQQQLTRVADNNSRPLIANSESPLQRLSELMQIRDPLYRSEADIIIRTDNISKNEIVDKLEKKILIQ